MSSFLSPSKFAQALRLSESTIRRWCDSGKLSFVRTTGGHRRIPIAEAVNFVRRTGMRVIEHELLLQSHPPSERARTVGFEDALLAGNGELAYSLIEHMYLDGRSVADLCDNELRRGMERVGKLWPKDKRAILVEHRASTTCLEIMHRLRQNFSAPGGAVVIGGAPSDDPYLLPTSMVATVLAELGFRDMNLGANTPVETLAFAAAEIQSPLVWFAMTAERPAATMVAEVENLCAAVAKHGGQVVLGGRVAGTCRFKPCENLNVFGCMSELAAFARGIQAAQPK